MVTKALRTRAARNFPCVSSSWRQHLRRVVFVPLAAEPSLEVLRTNGAEAFRLELERNSALGSAWASALLGYNALLLGPNGARNTDLAVALCNGPAARGDAYAQYVLAWALYLRGEHLEALNNFGRSAKQLFPPAALDMVGVSWRGGSLPAESRDNIAIFMRHANNVGHAGAWLARSMVYRSGKLGLIRKLLGYAITPVALAHFYLSRIKMPFSARVFVFDIQLTRAAGGIFEQTIKNE